MTGHLPRKALIVTLGCRLNTADTALLTSRLEAAGYKIFSAVKNADLVVLNSCTVTAEAGRKSRQAVRKLRRLHPRAVIVAAGCAAALEPEAFRADGADFAIANPGKKELVEILNRIRKNAETSEPETTPVFRENALSCFPFRRRAFIKIQEGCNNFCTYCIVPHVRGRERSRAFDEVLADCRKAVEAGVPELVLTGVNTCAYDDAGRDLGTLIKAVAAINGDFRIRLSSSEPRLSNLNLLQSMADTPKVCRFLHLSLQHGCDKILRAMNRHYTTAEFARFVNEARRLIPDLHVGTDVIAGFPGESEEDFAVCEDFVRKLAFANVHVFTYSRRPGTPAAVLPDQVPAEIAVERAARLRAVAAESAAAFAASQRGKTLPVIFERETNGIARGWSDNYLEVRRPAGVPLGKIIEVVFDGTETNTARPLGETPQ